MHGSGFHDEMVCVFDAAVNLDPAGLGSTMSFTAVRTRAHVKSETEAICKAPTLDSAALGVLRLTNDCGTLFKNGTCSNSLYNATSSGIRFHLRPAVTVAVGRRPYIMEKEGEVIVKTDLPSEFKESTCDVFAKLVDIPLAETHSHETFGSWMNENRLGSIDAYDTKIFTIDLEHLPESFTGLLIATLICADGRVVITKSRRFQRLPALAAPESHTQVDHDIQVMRRGGEPYVGTGWYLAVNNAISGYDVNQTIAIINHQASIGVNTMMLYAMDVRALEDQTKILNAAHAVGVSVIFDMISLTYNISGAYALPKILPANSTLKNSTVDW